MNKKLFSIILTIVVYLVFTGSSYMLFSSGAQKQQEKIAKTVKESNDFQALTFDPAKPKTETCPLNGAKYSKEQSDWWKEHRPLGIMIENHEESRPQSGLSFADVIYESIAEGGITRFLAVFYCQDGGIVGPVRSARTYFLDWVSEYGQYPLYTHVGGANTSGPADALGQIIDYGWNLYNDMNQFSIGFPTFKRDEGRQDRPVATEHTMYSTTSKLWQVAKSRGLTNKDKDGQMWDKTFEPYTFKEDQSGGSINTIHIEFWEGYKAYAVDWTYDPQTDTYTRNNGGAMHKDRNTGKQFIAKNIVVLKMKESSANDGYEGNAHRLFKNKGTGDAIIFQDGKEIKGKWKKADREDRTVITGPDGKSIAFNRGLIWFEILPQDGVLSTK